jgi:hypothetical protein
MNRRRGTLERIGWLVVLALGIAAVVAGSVRAQDPLAEIPSPKNLKVFPANTPKAQLVEAMKGFTRALGVRCQFCHVGAEGLPLSQFDFASDEKATKGVARDHMQVVMQLNASFFKDAKTKVTCNMCHAGREKAR